MNRDAMRVLQRVEQAWGQVTHGMQQMYQQSSVRPASFHEIFRLDGTAPDDEVKLLVGPMVFNLPERANGSAANLFIVVEGWLSFEGPDFKATPLKTKGFGTEIGYFRRKAGRLEHIYGAHYDMDEKGTGHPVFHAQISPKHEFGARVNDQFRLNAEVINQMGIILGTVRTPSAQMDVFSVLTQICADHLIWEKSADEVRGAFKALRGAGTFLVGAAHRLDYLNTPPANTCYRSIHWYDAPAMNPA